jgi:hypothetical protein
MGGYYSAQKERSVSGFPSLSPYIYTLFVLSLSFPLYCSISRLPCFRFLFVFFPRPTFPLVLSRSFSFSLTRLFLFSSSFHYLSSFHPLFHSYSLKHVSSLRSIHVCAPISTHRCAWRQHEGRLSLVIITVLWLIKELFLTKGNQRHTRIAGVCKFISNFNPGMQMYCYTMNSSVFGFSLVYIFTKTSLCINVSEMKWYDKRQRRTHGRVAATGRDVSFHLDISGAYYM